MQTLLLLAGAVLLALYAAYALTPMGRALAGDRVRRRVGVSAPSIVSSPSPRAAEPATRDRSGWTATATDWAYRRVGRRALFALFAGNAALCVALQLLLAHWPDTTGPVLILLLLCGFVAATALHLLAGRPLTTTTRPVARLLAVPWLPIAGAGIGLLCAAVGASKVASAPWTAQWWWLAAFAVPLLTLAAARALSWRGQLAIDPRAAGLLALVILAALAVRLPALTSSPPFVHGDEAACGLYGRIFNSGQAPLLSISWNALPMLSYAVCGTGLRLFGDNLWGLRLINVFVGTAGVAFTYLLGRELFGRLAGLLGGLILAVTFVQADLSRDGLHSIQGPTALTLTVYLVARWLRCGGALTAFLAGASIVLDAQVYWSARVAFVLVPVLLVYVALVERRLLASRWKGLAWGIVGLATCGLPVLALFLANPGAYGARDTAVQLLGSDPYARGQAQALYGTHAIIPVVLGQAWRNATTFIQRGDTSLQIGWSGAMLDTVSAALLPAALILGLLRLSRWPYALCLAWFGAVFSAGVLTIDAPWWPRLAALLPPVALLIGVLVAETIRLLQARFAARRAYRVVALAGVGILLLCLVIGNLRVLFVEYPATARQADPMKPTLLGEFLAHAPGADQTVLLSDGSMYLDYDTVHFLAPHAALGGCTLLPGQQLSACPLTRTSRLYAFLPGRISDVAWLQRQRPGGHVVRIGTFGYGAATLLAYELPAR